MDIGKDRFSLLSSCTDLVVNEGNLLIFMMLKTWHDISVYWHFSRFLENSISKVSLLEKRNVILEGTHHLNQNKIVTKKRWLWLRGPDDNDYDALILANLHIRPGAHSSSPWQPLIHPAAPSYGISLDIILLRKSSSPWQEQIRVDSHMSVSGSAKAHKSSGGHMGKAHLVRFGGRKMGKRSKRTMGRKSHTKWQGLRVFEWHRKRGEM